MIVYVNGDSHSAGAEAANTYCFADDDPEYKDCGRKPHPDNLAVSYSKVIADNFNADLYCEAESASCNSRIIRTTREYLEKHTPDLIIIGWSEWGRTEYLYQGRHWQIAGHGIGKDWPQELLNWHKEWIVNSNYHQQVIECHETIWQFHQEIINIPHIFFNCFSAFTQVNKYNWGNSYIGPYDDHLSYRSWLVDQGFNTVNSSSDHFGADAHQAWANFLQEYIKQL